MIGVTVQGANVVAERLLLATRHMLSATEAGVRKGTALVERGLKEELSAPKNEDAFWGVKGATTQGLTSRSGRTRASITGGGQSIRYGAEVVGAVGSSAPHLKKLEDGGTIHGTSPGGYARIPTALAMTSAGVERAEFAGRSLRDVAGIFLIRTSTGRLWAARAAGGKRSGRVDLLYLLVKSFTLKPHKVFERTKDKSQGPVNEIIKASIELSLGVAQ